jgi:hypothetical protein
MIPTAHLRWFRDGPYKPPVLQQLWAPTIGDETHFYPAAYLEAQGGEWRDIPTAFQGEPT